MPRAGPLLKRSLAVREKVLGPDHPDQYPWLGSELTSPLAGTRAIRTCGSRQSGLPCLMAILWSHCRKESASGLCGRRSGVDQEVGAR